MPGSANPAHRKRKKPTTPVPIEKNVGLVVQELKGQAVYGNTILVFLSDNARSFHRAKTSLYDSGIKTPLIVVWPGEVTADSTNQNLVSAVDLAPTLTAAAKLPAMPGA